MKTVRQQVAGVLRADTCTGCGACTLLDVGLTMHLNPEGFMRPIPTAPPAEQPGAARSFTRVCPGREVVAHTPPDSHRHPLLGSYLGIWEAWSTDPAIRHRGSSGGALTALHTWLLETGAVTQITTAASTAQRPTRTVAVRITSREQALGAAGSRYAPVSVAAHAPRGADCAVTAKPCEVSALRALSGGRIGDTPLLLSFFCAGTPSQNATERLVRDLGGPGPAAITDLWYRGRGWPGRFTARFRGGEVSADYDTSWGKTLGPATQWRCKICPDGVGEAADIAAADSWDSDAQGYPVFTEQQGRSALIARTRRGLAVVLAAQAAGVLELRPLDPDQLAQAQPLQTNRRQYLAARLGGTLLAGRAVPRYRGFGLLRLTLRHPRQALRTLRGTLRRVRVQLQGGTQ